MKSVNVEGGIRIFFLDHSNLGVQMLQNGRPAAVIELDLSLSRKYALDMLLLEVPA